MIFFIIILWILAGVGVFALIFGENTPSTNFGLLIEIAVLALAAIFLTQAYL